MRNVWPENDAEHTLQTVAIAHGLAVIRKKFFMNHVIGALCYVSGLS